MALVTGWLTVFMGPALVDRERPNAPKALTELQLKDWSIKRLQTPDDLLGTLVFLASSDSDFMTRQAIVVDGEHFSLRILSKSSLRVAEHVSSTLDLTRKVTDDIRTFHEILGHKDVNTTMINTDVLSRSEKSDRCPADSL